MPSLQTYAVALASGLLVGVIYGLLDVRSPAPPVIALVGLLGILAGEQLVPITKQLLGSESTKPAGTLSGLGKDCASHLFGALPGRGLGAAPPAAISPPAATERSA